MTIWERKNAEFAVEIASELFRRYPSMRELERFTGMNYTTIWRIVHEVDTKPSYISIYRLMRAYESIGGTFRFENFGHEMVAEIGDPHERRWEFLTVDERDRLEELEGIIERGVKTFIEVGTAMEEIRDSRLYRETHGTFELYCRERWNYTRQNVYYLIDGARTANLLSTVVDIANERQARALSGMSVEDATEVVNRAESMLADGEKLTAFLLKEVREDYEYEKYVKTGEDDESDDEPDKPDSSVVYGSSESNEWYTPYEYVEAARSLMGEIDLDPASCEYANHVVKAETIYTIEDDGLDKPWFGRVFLNPPYGRNEDRNNASNAQLWSERIVEAWENKEITEGVLLVNSNVSERWFAPLWDYVICFPDHRIRFQREDGGISQPVSGNAFVYFGDDEAGFVRCFAKFGPIVKRVG